VVVAHIGDIDLMLVTGELARCVLSDNQTTDNERIGLRCAQRDRWIARRSIVGGTDVLWVVGIYTRCTDGPATGISTSISGGNLNVGGCTGRWSDQIPDLCPVLGIVVVMREIGEILDCVERYTSDGPVCFCCVENRDNSNQDHIVGVGSVLPGPRLLVVFVD